MIAVHFDVVAQPGPVIGERQPSPEGVALVGMLMSLNFSNMQIITDLKSNLVELWLIRAGFAKLGLNRYADDLGESLRTMSALHGRVEWYIDVDPSRISISTNNGFPALLVGLPTVVHAGMLPVERIPWDTLVSGIVDEKVREAA